MEQYHRQLQQESFGLYCGKITKIVGMKIESMGPISRIGDLCEIYSLDQSAMILAEVIGIEESKVFLLPYQDMEGIGYGSRVVNTNQPLTIGISNQMIGRIIDPLGNPLDGLGPIATTSQYPTKGSRYNPFDRPRIEEVLSLGVKAIDGMMTVGKGQRMGIFAGSGVGKSTLLGMIARNVQSDVNVIALVGERGREVNEFIQKDLGVQGLARSVIVVATSDQPAMLRSKCALTATTIAEYFKDQGKDVLLMMDSLTRFAMAQRDIGLSAGEAPIARGYTPSIYSALPQLLERAGRFKEGSITGLYTVLVEGDDTNEPISDTVRGILDGHMILSRQIAMKNHYPAIDVLASLSRLMNDITDKTYQTYVGQIRQWMALIKENEDLISIGAYKPGSNLGLDEALRKSDLISKLLIQAVEEHVDYSTTVSMIERIVKG